MQNLIYRFTKSGLFNNGTRCLHTQNSPLLFKLTPFLSAEPLKKKKKTDPEVMRKKLLRKERRLEKQIKLLENCGNKLKPIDEIDPPITLLNQKESRSRTPPVLSEEEQDERYLLIREWTNHSREIQRALDVSLEARLQAQANALAQLKEASEELYLKAVQLDASLLPLVLNGPTETPPIQGYDYPCGDYHDVTRDWSKVSAH